MLLAFSVDLVQVEVLDVYRLVVNHYNRPLFLEISKTRPHVGYQLFSDSLRLRGLLIWSYLFHLIAVLFIQHLLVLALNLTFKCCSNIAGIRNGNGILLLLLVFLHFFLRRE